MVYRSRNFSWVRHWRRGTPVIISLGVLGTGPPLWLPAGKAGTASTAEAPASLHTNASQNQAHQDQVVKTDSQAFRHPFYDAKAQYQRAQISLIDQQFSALQAAQNIPNLATVFGNEPVSIDADVYRLQIAYLNTL